jgi:Ca2+-transporting ATPase
LLDPASTRFIVLSAGFKALCAFAILGVLPRVGVSLESTRTAAFLFMAAGQLLFAYPARRSDLQPEPNRVLHGAILLGVLLQLPIALIPDARAAFDMAPLSLALWGLVALAALVSWTGAEVAGRFVWKRF